MIVIKHNIQISVRSIQNFGSEPEVILTKTTGSYCLKNGFHTISYYELDEYGNTTDNFRKPIYKPTASYGHFGRKDLQLPWEWTDKATVLQSALAKMN